MLKNEICDRTGESNVNKYSTIMTIIKYDSWKKIRVKFSNGYETNTTYQHFKDGGVLNPYDKSVYGIGYIGEGKYKASINGKSTLVYKQWRSMIQRCYDKKFHKKNPTYIGCSVCDEWLNFQVFGEWFKNNYYENKHGKMCLDKDILFKGNRIYSPRACIFVPERINVLFTKNDINRGDCPIGVCWHIRDNIYEVHMSIYEGEKKIYKYLGRSNCKEEAFNIYKLEKENYIKQVADGYKYDIPIELYNAMYNWVVEIDD